MARMVSNLHGCLAYRYHVVLEFNKGAYGYIIAKDKSGTFGEHDEEDEEEVIKESVRGTGRRMSVPFKSFVTIFYPQLLQRGENPYR